MSISISVAYVAEIERLRTDNAALLTDLDRVLTTLRYLIGIAERGEGRPMTDEETAESFVLRYVKRLEAELAEASKPDCRFCCFRFPLKNTCALENETGGNACIQGSRYKPFGAAVLAPTRIYEIDAAMAGGAK